MIETEADYTNALSTFEVLMGEVAQLPDGAPPPHSLKRLYVLLAEHIEAYERRQVPVPDAAPHQVLHFLMERHGLHQADLPEVGSQGVVSELLSGKRQLKARQVKTLAQRFGSVLAFSSEWWAPPRPLPVHLDDIGCMVLDAA